MSLLELLIAAKNQIQTGLFVPTMVISGTNTHYIFDVGAIHLWCGPNLGQSVICNVSYQTSTKIIYKKNL